jgi:exonuclease VII large subunit
MGPIRLPSPYVVRGGALRGQVIGVMMAVDERARHELYRALEELIGQENARTLMDQLPSDRPATKQDVERVDGKIDAVADRLDAKIDAVADRLDAKIDVVAARLDTKIDAVEERLDARIDALEERLDAKIDHVHKQMTTQMEALEHRVVGVMYESVAALRKDMASQLRTFVFATIGALLTLAVVAFGAARLV